jgi:peroxiredoxin
MTIAVGDTIPDVEGKILDAGGNPRSVQTGELMGTGRVVLFAVPGAFTPGCSRVHLPGFVAGRDELAAKGVDKVVCTSVNDAWVMDAWGRSAGADDIVMLADGNGDFAGALGLTMDATGYGLGLRSMRYAAVIQDGVVEALEVDAGGQIEASSCSAILGIL